MKYNCEHCSSRSKSIESSDSKLSVYIYDNRLMIDHEEAEFMESIYINFCPVCGKEII
ncbi:hypothetical protein SAMN05421839_12525 [Halolactibacillus halophilus]|uniref:Uncharacterized protein n=1 Tax=Halolactibacillus halophilus TaxID=306540 RepID=A0A1I5QWZ0_9BACI|nr:hypothetical protein HHA03_15440 [Halolactibacillus halophilus]SFP50755.1 hypothetical protein SAMN05421839_12525 [Halolactibacillus halophilus]